MEILYCDTCGLRITEADLNSGQAFRDTSSEKSFCPKCAPTSRPTRMLRRSSGENVIIRPARATPSQTRVPPTAAPRPVSAKAAPVDDANKNKLLVFGGIGAGLFGVVLIAMMMRGGKKEQAKADTRDKPVPVAPKPPETDKSRSPETPTKLPEAPQQPSVTPATERPAIPAKKDDAAIDDIRLSFARRKWAELKAEAERMPADGGVRKKVKDFASTYASTEPGKEAAELYKKLAANDPPPPGPIVFAGLKKDYKRESPAPGWRYLWNPNGNISQVAKYAPLVWNEAHSTYCGDSQKFPTSHPAHYVSVREGGGHPGGGDKQGTSADRYAIAAYTLQPGQSGKTAISGSAMRPDAGGGRVDLKIFVNDQLKSSNLVSSSGHDFVMDLGVLKEGDTIYVAFGPDHDDANDTFRLDFTIYPFQ